MQFKAHGQYRIEVYPSRLVVVSLMGSWNTECYMVYAKDISSIGLELEGSPSGWVFDLSDWQLGDSATMRQMDDDMKSKRLYEYHPSSYKAYVIPDKSANKSIIEFVLGGSIHSNDYINHEPKYFNSRELALTYMAGNGFNAVGKGTFVSNTRRP